MKRKLTPSDLALWAALPMAQTSKIGGRLTMILDKARNRQTLPRRVLLLSTALGAAALVPLAMLRPAVQARAVSREAGPVQLLGIQDIDIHHTDHRWWDAEGRSLAGGVNAGVLSRTATDLFRSSNDKNLRFAVRLPSSAEPGDVTFALSGSYFPRLAASPVGSRGEAWSLCTAFPGSDKSATLSVGVAAGPWTEVVDCPKTAGKVGRSRPSGDVLFTLIPHPQEQVPAQIPPGEAVLMVSDHFHSPSPLPVDKMAEMISSYASRTRSADAVQRSLHDGENEERTVYGLDQSGRVIANFSGSDDPGFDADDRFKMQQLIPIPRPLLTRIASFRLAARPYRWTEFKNVALQPAPTTPSASRSAMTTSDVIPPQDYATDWTSQITKSYWQPHTTFHFAVHIAPGREGTRLDPPVTGRLVYGPGQASHFSVQVWKPGRSNFLTVKFDYTPKVADKVHPDIIHLLTKQGTVAGVLTYYSL